MYTYVYIYVYIYICIYNFYDTKIYNRQTTNPTTATCTEMAGGKTELLILLRIILKRQERISPH